jgi:hypothetical protein
MAKRNRIKELEKERGDLHNLIPALVNKQGQAGAAAALDTTQATISNWLKANHYRKVITYVKEPA